jgi:esterase/lipase
LASLVAIKQKYKNVYRDAYFLDWPILVLKSGNDKYLVPRGMDFFVMGIKKNLLTEKNYSKQNHDLYNGNDNTLVFNDLLEWINTHEKIS